MWYEIINITIVCLVKLYFTFLSWGHAIGGQRDSRFRRRRRPTDRPTGRARESITCSISLRYSQFSSDPNFCTRRKCAVIWIN